LIDLGVIFVHVWFGFSFDVSWPAHFLNVSPDHGVIQPL